MIRNTSRVPNGEAVGKLEHGKRRERFNSGERWSHGLWLKIVGGNQLFNVNANLAHYRNRVTNLYKLSLSSVARWRGGVGLI